MTPTIEEWLATLELEHYAQLFADNEVDLPTLAVLTEGDLEELGIPFGPRKRIVRALQELREDTGAAPAGERRQLTVLFCDMVGFTDLAGRIDPEVLQTVVQRYEETCAACIARYDGYVFQRLGDAVVAFFGFPLAHEGEAERATRAALEIIEALATLDVPEAGRLRARIGIATGVVVVSTAERGAVGETMNLAARLQGIAEPDQIVVSERVHRLAGGVFDWSDLGEHELKGITRPTRAFGVVGLSAAASRFDAATHRSLSPMVGREEEIELLRNRWHEAQAGGGRVVLVSGEAGIGKSRVASALRERLEAQRVNVLGYQCSPYHVNSAFYPTIDHLERALRFGRDEPAESRLDRVEALVSLQYGRPIDDVRYVAAILSLPHEQRYGAQALTPQRRKEETIRVLVDLIEAAARARPTLVLFEDVHWADPTTLEVLDALIARALGMPLLAVLTTRPEFDSPWSAETGVDEIQLARLTPEQSAGLVGRITGGLALPSGLLEQIVEKTDGVPLFVEELTQSILESATLREEDDRYVLADESAAIALPPTLRDLLMARLDRAKPVKEIAQIGAAIGRVFSYELIAAVAPLSGEALGTALAQLEASGLAFRDGEVPEAQYGFKHALVRDAAYSSLLKSRRQQLHARIAAVLEERFPATKETEPELLAQHCAAGGLDEQAVGYWTRAGELAMQRFAMREAGAHLRKALELVTKLPAGPERDLRELKIRRLLGPAIVARHGWAAADVGVVLEPAWKLAKSLDDRRSFLPILHGLWVHELTMGRLEESLQWAETMLAEAAAAGDEELELCGRRAAMTSHYWLGNLVEARDHGDVIRALYDDERHGGIVALTNSDPLTGDGIYRGQFLWMLGYPEQAIAVSHANFAHARRRNHPFDHAFALTLGAQVFDFCAEPERLLEHADEAVRVGREHGVPVMSEVLAEISKGIALLRGGHIDESIPQLREAIARLERTRQQIWLPYLEALLAEAVARAGDNEAALAIIETCLADIEARHERPHLAEVLRLKGWILWRLGRAAEAELALRDAVAFAAAQRARSWELRAAMTLAELLHERGEREAARDALRPVYDWFDEGFETQDLERAAALLEALEQPPEGSPQERDA